MTKLTELNAEFVGRYNERSGGFMEQGNQMHGAQGVLFDCPLCGGHSILAWFKGKVPDDASPGPGRWTPIGTSLEDLTLTPSINLDTEEMAKYADACKWHGYVTNGDAK